LKEKFPIHWLEEIIDKISERNTEQIILSTGKTPSGHIHIGILREILICDALRRIFEEKNKKVKFFLFFDSFDAAKRFPKYIDINFQKSHKGKPFYLIPCPYNNCNCKSYAHHFGNELLSSFEDFGIKATPIWTHELYQSKEMENKIKIALENTDKIKDILKKYILPTLDKKNKQIFIELQKNWMPAMVICEKCNKLLKIEKDNSIIPNRVLEFIKEKQKVSYQCSACGNRGELSIYSGKLKLNWRVDWPAKWSIYKTTCEPAGKDHSVKGGAYDTGLEICQKVFGYEGPVKVPYEWLRFGDQDMKTSKGIIFTPKKYLKIAEPEIFRALILKTNPTKHISFRIEEIPQYYDFYERMEEKFFSSTLNDNDENRFLYFLYPLTQIKNIPNEKKTRIPLKLLIFLSQVQNILSINKLYEKAKMAIKSEKFERDISLDDFKRIISRTTNWINEIKKIIENETNLKIKKQILRKIEIFNIPERIGAELINSFDFNQKKGISLLREYIINNENLDPDLIQNKIFFIANEELKIKPRKLFEAIYLIILGTKHGPRLGSFLSILDKEWLINRLDLDRL